MTVVSLNASGERTLGVYIPPTSSDQFNLAHFLNGSITQVRHNYIQGGEDAEVFGTPILDNGCIFNDNVDYIETNFRETTDMCLIVLAKVKSYGTTGTSIVSNGGAKSGTFGVGLVCLPNGNTGLIANRVRGGSSTSAIIHLQDSVLNEWRIYSANISEEETTLTNEVTKQSIKTTSQQSGNRVSVDTPFRIGANFTNTYDGSSEVLVAIGYNRKLTRSELDLSVERIKFYAESKGIFL